MGRWTQYEEDSSRLPEGFRRIGYDADSGRYSFCDRSGVVYLGQPGEEYGKLTKVSSSSDIGRPEAFASASNKRNPPTSLSVVTDHHAAPTTFHDILPPNLITSPSSADSASTTSSSQSSYKSPSSGSDARSRFINAARRTALPKMHGVVQSLRRSATSAAKHGGSDTDSTKLLRSGSVASDWSKSSTSSEK